MGKHRPVLVTEALAGLAVVQDGCYVDGTYGRGGHSAAILRELGPEGRLLALDQDPDAVADAKQRFQDDFRFAIRHAGFEDMRGVAADHFGDRAVLGVLLDLGVSSPQLERAERGFSFSNPGPLDMRMNPEAGITAGEWLGRVGEADLVRSIRRYGEEPHARRIAAAIVKARRERPITTTDQLADIIGKAVPRDSKRKIHPATRVFQAIRIAVNDELTALREGLDAALELLAPGGRCAAIAYHSLEDRIVKQRFTAGARGCVCPPDLPVCACGAAVELRLLTRRPVEPSAAEIEANPRARSARLRAVEKLSLDRGAAS